MVRLIFWGMVLMPLWWGCESKQGSQEKGAASGRAPAGSGFDAGDFENGVPEGISIVLFFGNSLSAGYGLNDPETEAFPGRIQAKIDSAGLPFKVVNAGLSGETTAGGKNRIDWVMRQPIDIFVLELGGNDGLRGIDPEETYRNLQSIIDQVKARYPEVKIVLAGMEAPPNLGEQYTTAFRSVYPRLAEANEVVLIPFLLEGVGGVPELNLPDGIHPTARGHQRVADLIWPYLVQVFGTAPDQDQPL
jgi:acyl-CoA thioesterase-1